MHARERQPESRNPAQKPPRPEIITKMDNLIKSSRLLARGGPEAEIQPGSRQARKSSKMDDLSESGRMLARGAVEAEVRQGAAQGGSHRK